MRCDQYEGAFKKIQSILANPYNMVAPSPSKPFLLYIANIEK